MVSGIFHTKLLPPNSKYMSEERFPREGGIPPAKLFLEIASRCSLIKEPSSSGIFPVSLFTRRRIDLRLEQMDKLDGISPPNVLLLR